MIKDFNKWNNFKKNIEVKNKNIYANLGEVWWSNLGINIGSESCGKNNFFERPVLVIKVFNSNLLLVIPLTTRYKDISMHIELNINNKKSFLMLEQIRVISSKRLTRKINRINKSYLNELFKKVIYLLF